MPALIWASARTHDQTIQAAQHASPKTKQIHSTTVDIITKQLFNSCEIKQNKNKKNNHEIVHDMKTKNKISQQIYLDY